MNVSLQGPDAGIQRHYHLRSAMICVDSHDPSSYSEIQQPLDTPLFADEVKEGKNNKEIAQTSKAAALQVSLKNFFGINLSYGRNNGTEVGTTSEWTRFQKQIIGWNAANIAKWTYFRSDKGFLNGLNLPANSSELPIVNFDHPDQKNKGMPPEKMTVKLSSLWVTQVKDDGAAVGDQETSRFSNFWRKPKVEVVEPPPIYTNIVPCVVIDFQPQARALWSGWTHIQKKLFLQVDADIAQEEQPGEAGVEKKHIHVIPLTHRTLSEQRAKELFEA